MYFYHYSIKTESGNIISRAMEANIKVLSNDQYGSLLDHIKKTEGITEPFVVISFSYLGRAKD